MAKRILIVAVCLVLIVVGYWVWPERKRPDSPELATFKAFLQKPDPVRRIAFSQLAGDGRPVRFEGLLAGEGFRLMITNPNGNTSERGIFNGTPWSHSSNGLEVVEFYREWPPALKQQTNETGGLTTAEHSLLSVLNAGIFGLKRGSLEWDGNRFTGLMNGRFPISGRISHFNEKGLPRRLSYAMQGGPALTIELDYGGTNVPAFFPTSIRRRLPWHAALRFWGRAPDFNTQVQALELGEDPGALGDPLKRHPHAMRLDYTNGAWVKIEGTNVSAVAQ